MDRIDAVIFFLQILGNNDLGMQILQNIAKYPEEINVKKLHLILGLREGSKLVSKIKTALLSFGVINIHESNAAIDKLQLEIFIDMVTLVNKSRQYKWPEYKPKPFIFVSPPSLISSEISGDADDISNFLINLVSSTQKHISIMSPYTNREGLVSILTPLKSCKNSIKITLYLTASDSDKEMIYHQIIQQIPKNMLGGVRIFFCSSDRIPEGNQPHAKVMIIDSEKGYLGSANFTKQGLTTRFELGVELDEQQSKTSEHLFNILIKEGLFEEFKY